ncbi:hypothetical protein NLI96_g10607 [Meripilus lineatus]|uniref:Protein kinase domain-containing protein n=1 Tax=Meripilus lineatus TaxID=2056292 RepID=A0AAD5UTA6_9APHY|nr:hypothetical protein NLI96_g10607 [Physisporinus lineatus]
MDSVERLITNQDLLELFRQEKERQKAFPPATNLLPDEIFWRDHQVWLQEKGYMLRPRYHPDWIPSSPTYVRSKYWAVPEDATLPYSPHILDAKRISTGELVMLKKVSKTYHPEEADIHEFLTADPFDSYPENHCAPLYETLQSPNDEDITLLVLPLYRRFDDPPFETVGEIVEFFRQIFEGLRFMHQCHVAHW